MHFVTIDFETLQYAEESAYSVGLVKYQEGAARTCGKLVLLAAEKFGCTNLAELLKKANMEMGRLI